MREFERVCEFGSVYEFERMWDVESVEFEVVWKFGRVCERV